MVRQWFTDWAKLLAWSGLSQALVQALGLVSGILVIRLLSQGEYALYTVANSMLGTMTVLADGGISNGVMAQGGKVWKDREKLGAVIVTGLSLRRKFAVFSLLVATPILFYLLRHHGASWLMATLIVVTLIPAFFSALSGTLLEIAPKLKQDILPLQRVRVSINGIRLGLTWLLLFAFPLAGVAILASGLAQVYGNFRLRRLSRVYADRSQPEDPAARAEILSIVKRVLPGAVYYALSGQITIWLISIFGTTEAVAKVGALSRLAMILTLFNFLFGILIVPRFARLPDNRKVLVRRFVQIQAGFLVLGVGIVAAVWLFPKQILWVLGEDYAGLTSEVVMMAAVSAVGLMHHGASGLMNGRGIVPPPAVFISTVLVLQVALVFFFDFSIIMNVLLYSLLTRFAIFSFRCFYFFYAMRLRQ